MCSPVQTREWESKAALLSHLGAFQGQTLLLTPDAEAPSAYHSFSISSHGCVCEVGVVSSGLGAGVVPVVSADGRGVFVGYDALVVVIAIEPLAVTAVRKLGGVFYEFVAVDGKGAVVLHELGITRLNSLGVVVWSVDTDIVESMEAREGGNVALSMMDGGKVTLSLETGQIVSAPALDTPLLKRND
jgi:hypothetical protein